MQFEFANAFNLTGTDDNIIPNNGGTIAPPKNNKDQIHPTPTQKLSKNGTGAALKQHIIL